MILVSHALIGASVARIVSSNPVASFFLGLATHYAADAVPHWQYERRALMTKKNSGGAIFFFEKGILRDVLLIGFDFVFGILLSLYFFSWQSGDSILSIALGAFGGMFPDAIQFLYALRPKGLLKIHQRFHDFVHTKNELPENHTLGTIIQISIVVGCVVISRIIK